MAGGSGTRFWPSSRAARPKQFLALGGMNESLLQATVSRVQSLVGIDHVLVVAAQHHATHVESQLPGLPRENILYEPVSGETRRRVLAWASAAVRRRDPQAVIAALPADHRIEDPDAFRDAMRHALDAATHGAIVTLGIRPTRPETGYGYLEVGDRTGEQLYRVHAFVEKPTRDRAEQFLQAGRYLWNSGMFFWADTILREIERSLPDLAAFVVRCDEAAARGDEAALIDDAYPRLASISIDYGVMEKARDVLVVPAGFGGNDLGSWAASWELSPKDEAGNASQCELLAVDARGCFASAESGKLVVLVGLQDIVAVDTADALLIMPRDRAQEVSKVVQALRASGKDQLL